jgi:AcrR family transcriptional regulator
MESSEKPVSRASEPTRRALVEAATAVFAVHGYEGGSVRLITQKARANQAAITYHFGGKDGLYREVLAAANAALEQHSLLGPDEIDALPPEEALRLFLRQFLQPLIRRDRLSRYLRIFAWEGVRPSAPFQAFVQSQPPRLLVLAERLARRFLPADAAPEEIVFTTLWLAQQPVTFVRDAEFLSQPPFSFRFDEAVLERLVDTLSRLSLGGLTGARQQA